MARPTTPIEGFDVPPPQAVLAAVAKAMSPQIAQHVATGATIASCDAELHMDAEGMMVFGMTVIMSNGARITASEQFYFEDALAEAIANRERRARLH